jgi:hypothetical protein
MTDLAGNPRETTTQTNARRVGGSFALHCLLAAMVTAACVQYSFRHGRLIFRGPMADDANYFVDGLQRLQVFDRSGFSGLVRSLINQPPHAPFSSLLAMISFAIFGHHAWAPYAGNGVIVLALLAMVNRLLPDAYPWQRGLAYALVLATRLPMTAIVEFRPDIACGLVTAWAILDAFKSPLMGCMPHRRIRLGALMGLSLLIKPSMAPVNVVLFTASFGLAITAEILAGPSPPVAPVLLRRILKAAGMVLLMALLVCLPYYLFAWRETYDYIFSNVFGGRKNIWEFHGTALDVARYYYDLPHHAGEFLLGIGHLYLLSAIVFCGVAITIWRGSRETRLRLIGLSIVTILAYAIPTIARTKNPFFGATFHSLLLLGAVISLRQFLTFFRCPGIAMLIASTVASVMLLQPPLNRGDPALSPTSWSNRLLDQVYATVQTGQIGDRIFIPAPGTMVSWNTMNYLSLVDRTGRRFTNLDYGKWDDQEQISAELDQADWVVVGDTGNDEARKDLPNGNDGLALYQAAIAARTDFAQVAEFPAWTLPHVYHVFHRTTPAFAGFDKSTASGLSEEDGPHPEWQLPKVRFALGPDTRLKFNVQTPGDQTIILSYLSKVRNEGLTVLLDGREISSTTCDADDAFHDLRIVAPCKTGIHELQIHCTNRQPAAMDPAVPVLMYRKIQILPQ